MLPPEKPATWAEGMSSARRTRGRVVGHHLDRDRAAGHGGPTRPAVVERGQAVAVGEPVELELPRLDGVAQAADEQNVRSFADLLGPDVEVTGAYMLPHSSALLRSIIIRRRSSSAIGFTVHRVTPGPPSDLRPSPLAAVRVTRR